MNYQMLLECHAAGTAITKQEAVILDLELDSQIASIKVSRTQGCMEVAPDQICQSALVCKGSFWITCFALYLTMSIQFRWEQKQEMQEFSMNWLKTDM